MNTDDAFCDAIINRFGGKLTESEVDMVLATVRQCWHEASAAATNAAVVELAPHLNAEGRLAALELCAGAIRSITERVEVAAQALAS